MTAAYGMILDATLATVRGLTLTGIDNPLTQIIKRFLPKASEELDTLPLVVVAPSETPEDVRPLSGENDKAVEVIYAVDIVTIAASQHDFASNMDRYLDWRETIRQAFQEPTANNAPTVFDTEIKPFSPFDRPLLNQNYAYCGLRVLFHSAERRK